MKIMNELQKGNINAYTLDDIININNDVLQIISSPITTESHINYISTLISICNMLYNNTTIENAILDDSIYDRIMVWIKDKDPNYQVGSPPIDFDTITKINSIQDNTRHIISYVENKDSLMYPNMLKSPYVISHPDILDIEKDNQSKKIRSVGHEYPELVGTLDKCKFVLNKNAREKGCFDDPNVSIFERDFLNKTYDIASKDGTVTMIGELKFDGISVEATVSDRIISARTRGDVNNDITADITPILEGYIFPKAKAAGITEEIGMKFEAIITYENLYRLNQLTGKNYINARTATIGIFGALDGYKYRDFITLVPLKSSIPNINRITELDFLNKYYTTNVYNNYAYMKGDYQTILFMVYRFVNEVQQLRSNINFMYDGVVVSYIDQDVTDKLGRKNSVNKYSVAIKFDPLVKSALFLGYSYTIGQNGVVTPMIHYTPVDFYGSIHTKSSGHSFNRINKLQLRKGDVLRIEYVNDVMPYVYREDGPNLYGNPIEPFATVCPSCGTELIFTNSGKSVICPNIMCPERVIARLTNMMQKLNLKDFAEESLIAISKAIPDVSLSRLFDITADQISFLGEVNSHKFIERINELKTKPIYDYQIVGALGFTSIAAAKWKLILTNIPLEVIVNESPFKLGVLLSSIKGIGNSTIETIVNERQYFMEDLQRILSMPNVLSSQGLADSKKIRFTGIRDSELESYLNSKGYDASGGSVTKDTDILIVPYEGFTSTKTAKASENTLIITLEEFKKNMDSYL